MTECTLFFAEFDVDFLKFNLYICIEKVIQIFDIRGLFRPVNEDIINQKNQVQFILFVIDCAFFTHIYMNCYVSS